MASRLELLFLGDTADLHRAFGQLDTAAEHLDDKTGKQRGRLAKFAGGMLAGLAAAGAAARHAAAAAADAETSTGRLEAQFRASGLQLDQHAGRIDQVVQRVSRLAGLDDEDLQDAFTGIFRATGDVTESLRLVGLTADIARAKNLGVAQAGNIVAKVAGGNTGILARYGIQLKDNATSADALAVLHHKFRGQAKAYGDTTQGAYDKFQVARENLEEVIGGRLTPAIAELAIAGTDLVKNIAPAVASVAKATGKVTAWVTGTAETVIGAVRAVDETVRAGVRWTFDRVRDGARSGLPLIPLAQARMTRTAVRLIGRELGDALKNIGGSMAEGILRGLDPDKLVKYLISQLGGAANIVSDFFTKESLGGVGLGGVYGKDQVSRWLTLALVITHHFSAANLRALYGRTMQESTGDPHAFNNWDSNAKAGIPSKGLLQTIEPTFNAYKLPGHDDIWNPVDNAIAAIRYMYARYGHIVGPSSTGYAAGGEFITRSPYEFLAGEAGPERVTITPLTREPHADARIHGAAVRDITDAHALAHRAAFLTAAA